MEKIDSFEGEYRFLSNFYSAPVIFEGLEYKNSEAAFQAAKTTDRELRKEFADLDPSTAKRKGRRINLRPDWEIIKKDIMLTIVRNKFIQNKDLREKLLNTGDAYLEEGNTWGDKTWGTVNGEGNNYLGKILMIVRHEFKIVKPSYPFIKENNTLFS